MMTEIVYPKRLCLTLWVVGVVAALSMLAAPMEALKPAKLDLSWWQFRLLSLTNPLVILTITVAGGCWAAKRVGLDAPLVSALLTGAPAGPVLRRQAPGAVIVGIATAAVLLFYSWWTAPMFAALPKGPEIAMPLVMKLLYGGVVEELMMRWGAMSLFVWLTWKALRSDRPGPAAFVIGAVLAAVLFAIGHLPMLKVITAHPPAVLVVAVLVGNMVPGLLFGLLFWKRGLEAAMLAHALGHLLFTGGTGLAN